MAQAPSGTDVADWDGSGDVWFKVRRTNLRTPYYISLRVSLIGMWDDLSRSMKSQPSRTEARLSLSPLKARAL